MAGILPAMRFLKRFSVAVVGLTCSGAIAQTPRPSTYGHSMKGEAFQEGPRQAAYLMPGLPQLYFPVATKSERAQRFFTQGIAQLHAYWYFEAERSFRQAAFFDPECAMAYWGMARANVNNRERAKGFCAEAWKRRTGVPPRERAWIESLAIWADVDGVTRDDKKRGEDYVAALRKLTEDFPLDTEARAFLAHELQERASAKDKPEVERLLQEVLAENPMHPVHHYRIHLWDEARRLTAVDSAARCGPSAPASAHMWHMSGHIYTQLKRYTDAVWSQEAASRTDHAHMNRARLMPDQIFNYAHNNQWLAENCEFVGRPKEALAIARNLIEHPRHPKYNTLDAYSSAGQGQSRLFETLYAYSLWPETRELFRDGLLEETASAGRENDRLQLLALATGEGKWLDALRARKDTEKLVAEVEAELAERKGDRTTATSAMEKAKLPRDREALWQLRLGNAERAYALSLEEVRKNPNKVLPLTTLVRSLAALGRKDEARERFDTLRQVAGIAELDTPILAALAPLAKEFGYPQDWRIAPLVPEDVQGFRPAQESLGPLLWSPNAAPKLPGLVPGKPTLVVFSLGEGCEKCVTQLRTVAEKKAEWDKLGVSILAITADESATVRKFLAQPASAGKFSFPIFSDPKARQFQSWGCYDDFEKMPLHGLYLVDGEGKIRWQDISYQAFGDVDFLLAESKRLLALK